MMPCLLHLMHSISYNVTCFENTLLTNIKRWQSLRLRTETFTFKQWCVTYIHELNDDVAIEYLAH